AALAVLLVAGCGSASSSGGDAHELNAWTIPDDAFIPNVGRAPRAGAPAPKPKRAPQTAAGGAPTDAQIRAELKDVYGDSGGERRISLNSGRALAPPDAPNEVQAIVSAANQVARLPYVYGGGHG